MYKLIELNDDNYEELSKLKIAPSQQSFVRDFNGCVEYKKEYPFLRIFGIMRDDTYIGLTAFARWDSDLNIPVENRWTWFDEFFIDVKYQHKGYAKEAVELILAKIKEIYNPSFVILSVKNDNIIAKALYEKLGFVDTGLIYDEKLDSIYKRKANKYDEIVMKKIY